MQSLKDKTINAVLWNSVSNISTKGIDFIVGVILARLLTPKEFGLIGTITIVIVLSQVFVNSGFNQAIIRKQDCTQTDYSTAFFFNFIVAVILFILLFLIAQPLSLFFNNTELKPLIQVMGIGLIISSFTLIQQASLTKRLDFKLQTKIQLTSSVLSGVIGIGMAYTGYGVWSLVFRNLANSGFQSVFLWIWNKWKPDWIFSFDSFKELFGFGSKLLLSGLIGTVLNNLNHIIIAKYFSVQELGYYTRADMFRKLPSENVSSIITTVAYPVLASVQNDRIQLKNHFRKMFLNTFFIIVILMVGLAATSKALILTLIGEQWLPSVVFLQLLCFSGIMYPLNSMNINILNVVGRSDLYLKLQLIVQILAIPNIFIGVFFGIKALIIGMNVIALIGYVVFNHESNKVINYSIKEQFLDVFPSLALALIMGVIIFLTGYFSTLASLLTLILQIVIGGSFIIFTSEIFKIKEYVFIKQTLFSKIRSAI